MRALNFALLTVAALCFAVPAEARFGSHSSGGGHSASPSGRSFGAGHSVSPAPPLGGYPHRYYGYGPAPQNSYYPYSYWGGYTPYADACWDYPYCHGWGFGYRPYLFDSPSPEYYVPELQVYRPAPVTGSIGIEGQSTANGGVLSLTLAAEGQRWGFDTQFTSIWSPASDGVSPGNNINLLNLHATYAFLSSSHFRLRVGAGVDSAYGQDVTFFAPGVALSGGVGLFGPFGLDFNAHLTPFVFGQVDTSVGLNLTLGPVAARVGWRRISLSEAGLFQRTINQDVFSGPYLGLALRF